MVAIASLASSLTNQNSFISAHQDSGFWTNQTVSTDQSGTRGGDFSLYKSAPCQSCLLPFHRALKCVSYQRGPEPRRAKQRPCRRGPLPGGGLTPGLPEGLVAILYHNPTVCSESFHLHHTPNWECLLVVNWSQGPKKYFKSSTKASKIKQCKYPQAQVTKELGPALPGGVC